MDFLGDAWLVPHVLVFLRSPNSDLLVTFLFPCSAHLEAAVCDLLAWPLCSLTSLLGSARGRRCWRGSLLTWPAMVWAFLPHLACIPSVRHLLSQSYWVPEPSPRPVPSSQWPNGFPLLPIAARNWKHQHTFLAPFILPHLHKALLP